MDGKDTKVIVADDNLPVRESLVEFIADFGLTAVGAASAEEALELIRREKFNLGVIDLHMPQMGGKKLILQAHSIRPEMQFLICTGSGDFVLDEDLMKAGVAESDVCLKPIRDVAAFIEQIRHKSMR